MLRFWTAAFTPRPLTAAPALAKTVATAGFQRCGAHIRIKTGDNLDQRSFHPGLEAEAGFPDTLEGGPCRLRIEGLSGEHRISLTAGLESLAADFAHRLHIRAQTLTGQLALGFWQGAKKSANIKTGRHRPAMGRWAMHAITL